MKIRSYFEVQAVFRFAIFTADRFEHENNSKECKTSDCCYPCSVTSAFFSCWLSKSRFSALSVTAIKKDNIHIYRSCCPKYLVCNASGLFIQTATISTFDQNIGAKNLLKLQINFYTSTLIKGQISTISLLRMYSWLCRVLDHEIPLQKLI